MGDLGDDGHTGSWTAVAGSCDSEERAGRGTRNSLCSKGLLQVCGRGVAVAMALLMASHVGQLCMLCMVSQ